MNQIKRYMKMTRHSVSSRYVNGPLLKPVTYKPWDYTCTSSQGVLEGV